MSMDASEGKVCPYLQSSLSELQDHLHTGGFAHDHALSLALKLTSLPVCQLAAKVKVTNQNKAVPDEVTLTHTYGRWTVREDIKSSSKFKVTAGYQLSDTSSVSVEGDFAKRAVKAAFTRASSWTKCDATLGSDGGFQFSGTVGTQSCGGSLELKVQERLASYTLACYAKRPSFDLLFRLSKAKSSCVGYSFSYFSQLSEYVDVFAMAQYDPVSKGKTADVTLTCKYDENNWGKAQLTTAGELSCSLLHSLGPKVAIAYGLQTQLTGLIRGNTDVKYGMKLKLG